MRTVPAGGMEMLFTLVMFLLAVYGMANAVAVLKIGGYFFGTPENRKGFGRIPYVGDLVYCPACLSFWLGMAASMWVLSPSALVCTVQWKSMVLDGFAACAASYLFHVAAMGLAKGQKQAEEGL